jgi:hypothetical protein
MASRCTALVLLFLTGCGTTRPLEVPPPFYDSGVVVTVKPRVYIGWLFEIETIRGTVENRTGREIDLRLYLNLEDETGAVVGYAFVWKDDFRPGERSKFEAMPEPGSPELYGFQLSRPTPHYTKLAPGFAYDERTLIGQIANFVYLLRVLRMISETGK